MKVIGVVRRSLILAFLLSLAACATQGKIGDPSEPLMPPDSGLVAATVFFSNSVQPAVMKFPSFSFWFRFSPTDGQEGQWTLNSPKDRYFYSKDPRALPDDSYPKLLLAAVKPGKYRMTRGEVSQEADFFLTPKKSKEFEVVAGQVTYIGSISMFYTSRFEGKSSALTPVSFQMVVKNDFDRDVRELKGLDKRLESVVIRNALEK
jgi:hypothetical protein